MAIELLKYKKSINKSDFTKEQIIVIWEFYVTKALVHHAGQKRSIQEDYGQRNIPIKEMKEIAKFNKENYKMLLANKMDKTLEKFDMGVKKDFINDIDSTRAIFLAPYYIEDEEQPKTKKGEGEILLEHVRNALAHGGTYFFENKMMLLEDKVEGKVTARILMNQKVLLEWIRLIDKEERYYKICDV